MYADYVYEILRDETEGLETLYEDHIIELVGVNGLNALLYHKMLNVCGEENGNKLYKLAPAQFDWKDALNQLEMQIDICKETGFYGVYRLHMVLYPLKERFENGERTKQLYKDIMDIKD